MVLEDINNVDTLISYLIPIKRIDNKLALVEEIPYEVILIVVLRRLGKNNTEIVEHINNYCKNKLRTNDRYSDVQQFDNELSALDSKLKNAELVIDLVKLIGKVDDEFFIRLQQ